MLKGVFSCSGAGCATRQNLCFPGGMIAESENDRLELTFQEPVVDADF